MAGLGQGDRVVTCTIVRGEILFGIARLPRGRRRTELEETGRQLLDTVDCEPVPEQAGDIYAPVKSARQQRGLPLDENDLWVAATALASVRHWSAGTAISEVLMACESLRWSSR
jgi:predicted nucleic acid-binding protein